MDEATYALIGTAYAEVEAKEPWCSETTSVADIAVLSLEAAWEACPEARKSEDRNNLADAGAVRILTEGHYLYDIVDADADFGRYKVLILPDEVPVWPALGEAIRAFTASGGKVLATGRSGLDPAGNVFALDLGLNWKGASPYHPSYFRPNFTPGSLLPASFVMYGEGQQVELNGGQALGSRENPYFNRDVFTFCSHQHTPSAGEDDGPGMIESTNGIYIAWNVFGDYADNGHLILKEMVLHAIDRLLPQPTLHCDLPARGKATLQYQTVENRYIHHLLYASPVLKGRVEVIEDIVPLQDVSVSLRLPSTPSIRRVYLAPSMEELPYSVGSQGEINYTVPNLDNHQMVVLELV